jgi:carboxypeptidase family protein/TonB-dependent receptor-like protein
MTFRFEASSTMPKHGLLVVLAALLTALPAFSQANLGRILGAVADQSGGVVAGTTVTILDVQRGISRTLTTDDAGEYNAPNLTPGSYTVRAESKGFKTAERSGILLEVGKDIRVDLTLQPGEQAEKITVTGELPMVETTNATLGGTLSNETINELPLNGRNYQNLLSLRPGVLLFPGGGAYTQSANGTRAEDVSYLLDGLKGDEAYTGQSVLNAPIAAGDASTSLPIDAIQEFNTEENPKAEFGWKPGAIVNAGLKAGTNSIHGTAFAFGRDTAFDARNYFNQPQVPQCTAPCPKAPVTFEQFGASLGGPIKKDKLFYFVSYEGQRYSVGSTLSLSAPVTCGGGTPGCGLTKANPAVSLVDACLALKGQVPISPLSAQIAGLDVATCAVAPTNFTPGAGESLFPTNLGNSPVSPTTMILGLVSNNSQNNGVVKLDYHLNDKNTISGMYFNGRGGGIWNDAGYQVGVPNSSNSPWMSNLFGYIQMGYGAWTWTPASSWVNELRVGYDHYNQQYLSVDHNVNPQSYGINTGVTDPNYFGFPFVRFSSFTMRLGGNWPKLRGPDGSLQILDHVSFLRGNHAIKMGGEIINNTADPFVTASAKGTIRFGSNVKAAGTGLKNTDLVNFLAGLPRDKGGLSALLVGETLRHYSNQQYAAFLQDDWRIRPRLILNLGLRYEIITVLKDQGNLLGNFDPNAATGLVQVGAGESAAYHGDHDNVSPRIGLAWDINGNGKTVIRAGGSIMYEQLAFNLFDNVANVLGLNQVPTGATLVTCSTNPCGAGSTQVLTPAGGTIKVETLSINGKQMNFSGSSLAGGTTTVFPVSSLSIQCGDGQSGGAGAAAFTDPGPCNTEAISPNFETPYIDTWTVNVQRSLTANLSLEVAYVGTHGTRLLGFQDINQPLVGACAAGATACEQAARPYNAKFPYLAQIDRLANLDSSNYNGLQITLTQRPIHGLSYNLGYTYSHALDSASSNWNANPLPPTSYNPALQYGNSDFDVRNRFTLGITYALPGRKSPGQLLEGWAINSRVAVQSGLPWGARDTANDFAGNGQVNELNSFGQPWDFFGNTKDFTSGPNPIPLYDGISAPFPAACLGHPGTDLSFGCYAKGNSVLVAPSAGTLGTAGRNIFRDSGYRNWDFSVTKNWKFGERFGTQFRAEFFNILNHSIFTNPGGPGGAGFNDPSAAAQFGCGCSTPDQSAPDPVLGSGANRSIQLGLKLIW